MANEIDLSDVPLTPRGVNYDFKAVRDFEFVRFDENVSWKTVTLIGPESDVSDCDEEVPKNIGVFDDEHVKSILNSPMIEVRKKRPKSSDGEPRFNPVNQEVLDTASGWYKNYERGKRKTIAVIGRMSIEPPLNRTRSSLPPSINLSMSMKENVPPRPVLSAVDQQHMDLLIIAINESRPLLTSEYNRLSAAIVDWKHILKTETDIPPESQGNIQSTVGRTRVLLDKRFKSTLELLDNAEKFFSNNGVIADDSEKQYRADDVYAFVDILITEIKKVDNEFNRLLNLRESNWNEEEQETTEAVRPVLVRKEKPLVDSKEGNKKQVKSRIDIKMLRRKYGKKKTEEEDIASNLPEETEVEIENIGKNILEDDMEMDGISFEEIKLSENSPMNSLAELSWEVQMENASGTDDVITERTSRRSVRFDMDSSSKDVHESSSVSLNESGRSLRDSVRKTVRDNSMIKSTTGTPVHFDTPRPRKSKRISKLDRVSITTTPLSLSSKKRSIVPSTEDGGFLLPVSQPKKARQSKQ